MALTLHVAHQIYNYWKQDASTNFLHEHTWRSTDNLLELTRTIRSPSHNYTLLNHDPKISTVIIPSMKTINHKWV